MTDGYPVDKLFTVIGSFIALAFVLALAALVITQWQNPEVHQLVMEQFRVIVALPAAGLFAFLVVTAFQVGAGPIDVEIFGFKFKGAGGPAIMWVIAFLASAMMIQVLWKT